ncbi:ephrin-A4 isoform X2 [Hemicordylus capensis]|uniref:ephrin-A4 isoform X2 n=1 Tax=Hemicordylus capensis TaxID=884348 RepID=UPI002302959D|nr:ephrin-A4 isoform X2 [Hemicordylus capensis]
MIFGWEFHWVKAGLCEEVLCSVLNLLPVDFIGWLRFLSPGLQRRWSQLQLSQERRKNRFLDEDYAVQVAINDYLDIYCPHYDQPLATGAPEAFTLLMVDFEGYRGCYETPRAFKRWECNRPYAPYGPVRFSEKIQRFTPFSLGFEFQLGRDYYYISIPTAESPGRCLKLQVSVCCKTTTAEPVTEGPKSQPRGRGSSEEAAGGPGRSSAPSWPCGPCLGFALLPFLWH